ncbi:MAG: DUF2398 family protein [Eubacteriales bacterium]|nr:DUF2398 family protein [Eubacteriales bacterium]
MIWELINRNVIKKEYDPLLYSEMKECLTGKKNQYNAILNKLNWDVMITPEKIFLKKTVNDVSETMGIQSFKDKMDYVFLTGIYYYLNLNTDSVFTAEDMIEHLKIVFEKKNIYADFNSISIKYSLYRALTYCEKQGYLNKLDGDAGYLVEESPLTDGVLYFNTGYARDIEVTKEKETTINKVYRSLLLKPVLYYNDFNIEMKRYVQEHMSEIEDDFKYLIGSDVSLITQDTFSCLMIPNNAEIRNGRRELCHEFPKGNMKDLLLTRMLTYIKEYIISTEIDTTGNNQYLSMEQYQKILTKMKTEDYDWWTKEYQNMSIQQLMKITLKGLREWEAVSHDDKVVTIYPLASMIQGELI